MIVAENARRDWNAADSVAKGRDPGDCRCVPLFAGEWESAVDDVLLAARACAALGEVELHEERLGAWVERTVAITALGYARIRVLDASGEAAQSGGR